MTKAPQRPRRLRRKAILGLSVSGGLLALILSRLDLEGVGRALVGITPWAGVAVTGLFGVAIVCTGLRWRIGLRLAQVDLPAAATGRAVLGGHALNMLLFGPAGGDVAKCAAWSRWYGLPLHQLLVSAIMDRTLAALASLLFGGLVLALLLGSADVVLAPPTLRPGAGGWLAVAGALGLVLLGIAYRFRHLPFLRNLGRSLRTTFRAARSRPFSVVGGVILGLGSQVLMSVAMGVALWGVTSATVPWTDILWTFPLITAVAALPTSFGGAGVREGVAILLLARFGIPAEDLVVAGFVYLAAQLLWAGVGAAVLAWEARRHAGGRRDGNGS